MGNGSSDGTRPRALTSLGIQKSRRTHLGQNEPASGSFYFSFIISAESCVWKKHKNCITFSVFHQVLFHDFFIIIVSVISTETRKSKIKATKRLIRTGRTGHWLNHGKEHCLVGIKGNPANLNRGLDCDVLVAEVRDTSHKPDEIYGIIERLSPSSRKLELFGRMHNVQV